MTSPDLALRIQIAAGVDAAIVVAFVAIGRRTHEEGSAISALVQTAAPFVIALAVSWVVWRVWNAPDQVVTGLRVWLTTIVLGMLLRRALFDDGTALTFVIVATAFLGVFLVGWRVFATAASKRAAGVS